MISLALVLVALLFQADESPLAAFERASPQRRLELIGETDGAALSEMATRLWEKARRAEGLDKAEWFHWAAVVYRRMDAADAESLALFNSVQASLAAGDARSVRARLEPEIERLASTPYGPFLLAILENRVRDDGDTIEALRLIERLERGLDPERVPDHRYLACFPVSERLSLYLQLGVPDRGYYLLDRLWNEEGKLAGAGVLTDEVWLANRMVALDYRLAVDEYEEAIADADRFLEDRARSARLGDRVAALTYRRAVALAMLAVAEPGRAPAAAAALRTMAEASALSFEERVAARIRLCELEATRGRFDSAAAELVRIESDARDELGEVGLSTAQRVSFLTAQARLALDRGAARDALIEVRDAYEEAFDAFLEAWASTPELPGGVGFLHHDERGAVVTELIRLAVAIDGPESGGTFALRKVQQAQAMGSLARRLGASESDLATIRDRLLENDRHVLLLYVAGPRMSHLFVLDRSALQVVTLASLPELTAARDALVPFLTSRLDGSQRDALAKLSAGLTATFLPPEVSRRISEWSAITLCGIESIGAVPFELLRPAGGAPLGMTHAIDYLPSIPLGIALQDRGDERGAGPIDLLLVASPAPAREESGKRRAPIPFGDDEREAAAAGYPRERVRLLEGERATIETVAREVDGSPAVLEFVCHGVYEFARDRPPGLLLADGEVLWSEEIERWTSPRLVVLAACDAARGPLRRGDDGVQHLGGAFILAGAEGVVLSSVDLEYESTLALLERFHAALRGGDSPAEALRRARVGLAARTEFQDPWFHSMVRVAGLGHRPIFRDRSFEPARTTGRWSALVVLLLTLLILGGAAAAGWRLRPERRRAAGR